VPALLAGGRVIISTGTKTLQDQLYHRDLPRVRQALGATVDVALLKGRANYVCLHHLEEAAAQSTFAARDDALNLQKIRRFAATTMSGDRGDCADVPESSPAWAQATSTRENCLGSACRHYQDCFVMKARKRASEADVIVVNHHLFFADVVLRDEGAADLLPSANTVIFDEAHHLPDLARLFFGQSLATAQVLELARDVRVAVAQHSRETPALVALAVERAAREAPCARACDRGIALGAARAGSVRPGSRRSAASRKPRGSCRAGGAGRGLRNRARADELPRSSMARGRQRPREEARDGPAPEFVRWIEPLGSRPSSTRPR
jgi:ATP-dependent DNA helicase DinG